MKLHRSAAMDSLSLPIYDAASSYISRFQQSNNIGSWLRSLETGCLEGRIVKGQIGDKLIVGDRRHCNCDSYPERRHPDPCVTDAGEINGVISSLIGRSCIMIDDVLGVFRATSHRPRPWFDR